MASRRQAEFAQGLAEGRPRPNNGSPPPRKRPRRIREIAIGAAGDVVERLTGSAADDSAVAGGVDAA